MTTEVVKRSLWTWILASSAVGIPAIIFRVTGSELDPAVASLVFGIGIVGGAFLLSWAAEVAQLDVSASLAIAVLALIAVLPEYAIEAVLAWKAGASFDPVTHEITVEMQRVAANVTGSNRLLIGLGWSLVILIFWIRRHSLLDLRGFLRLEVGMLAAATLVTFLVFLMGQVHLALSVVLIIMYLYYLWGTSTQESDEPELMGVARLLGSLPVVARRSAVVLLFVYSATVIILAAEPFVDGLVETGLKLGIDEFILIQWLAPLASESPEIIVAVLFTLRANPLAGLTTLISSEVSQFTLLIGSMAVIFSLSAGQPLNFLLDSRQSAEFFLTTAVSVFGVLLIAPRLISWRTGLTLLGLFAAHLFFTGEGERRIFAYIYLGLAVALVAIDRRRLRQIFGRVLKQD